jgi:hypothetical protein
VLYKAFNTFMDHIIENCPMKILVSAYLFSVCTG